MKYLNNLNCTRPFILYNTYWTKLSICSIQYPYKIVNNIIPHSIHICTLKSMCMSAEIIKISSFTQKIHATKINLNYIRWKAVDRYCYINTNGYYKSVDDNTGKWNSLWFQYFLAWYFKYLFSKNNSYG